MKDWRISYDATLNVSIFPAKDGLPWAHLVVKKKSGNDGIAWDVLQRIKDDLCGEDALAIELYPPAGQVVNEINARHLWIVPDSLAGKLPTLKR